MESEASRNKLDKAVFLTAAAASIGAIVIINSLRKNIDNASFQASQSGNL